MAFVLGQQGEVWRVNSGMCWAETRLPMGAAGLLRRFLRARRRKISPRLATDREGFISGGLHKAIGRVVKGEHDRDGAHFSFAALWTATEVDALLFQEGIPVGDVGLLGIR